jgi:GNAT superfamily N-acetyltransferase
MDIGLEDATRRWVAGWARARDVGTGVVAGWPIVHLRSTSRAFELVCAEPDTDAWETLLDDIAGDRTAMLTLVSATPDRYLADLPHGVRVDRDDEVLMQLPATSNSPGIDENPLHTLGRARTSLPDLTPYDIEHDLADDRVTVRLNVDHTVAAEGTAAVVGADAVFDRIETAPAHRRRGLGAWVMAELGRLVVERGATTGLLVASPDGAALYRRLGWTELAPVRSLRGTTDR